MLRGGNPARTSAPGGRSAWPSTAAARCVDSRGRVQLGARHASSECRRKNANHLDFSLQQSLGKSCAPFESQRLSVSGAFTKIHSYRYVLAYPSFSPAYHCSDAHLAATYVYIISGQMFNQFEEKTAEKLQSLQSSSQRRPARQRSICKHEQYFVCSESFSRDPKSSGNQCRHILICFNTKLLNFVQTVVEVLRNVNREKADSLAGMLDDSPIVAAKLAEMEDFVDSLENFSFVSSPQSFTCVPGYAIENALQHKSSKQPVAKTLILESDDISVYHRVLENIRQSISDFCTKPGVNSKSIHSLVDSDSTISVLSHASTAHRKSSKISFSVEKPVGKIASNESASKSYGAIQQDFHESANARLAKVGHHENCRRRKK